MALEDHAHEPQGDGLALVSSRNAPQMFAIASTEDRMTGKFFQFACGGCRPALDDYRT
jgi:hypothetical protein